MPAPISRLGRLDVLLVRHAEAVAEASAVYAEGDQPLTEAGHADAESLAQELEPWVITGVYSSPYVRAVATVEPAARRRGLSVQTLPDLRERRLSGAQLSDWREHLDRSFGDADYAPDGGETGREAQRRGVGVLDLLRVRHPDGGRLLVASHGNLITLILQALEPRIGFGFWEAMPTPAIYWLEHDGLTWRARGGYGLEPFLEEVGGPRESGG